MEELKILKRLRSHLHDEENDEDDFRSVQSSVIARERKFLRRRWDSEYLLNLAEKEGSFVAEYRVDPKSFDILVGLLEPRLQRNVVKAENSLSGCGSEPISVASRLGIALIMLAGYCCLPFLGSAAVAYQR